MLPILFSSGVYRLVKTLRLEVQNCLTAAVVLWLDRPERSWVRSPVATDQSL